MTEQGIINQIIRLQTSPFANWLSVVTRQKRLDDLHAALDQRGYNGPRPARALIHISPAKLNEAFFAVDPMHTCCRENGCHDEYQLIAESVYARLERGMVIEAAIDQALCANFGEELVDGAAINAVLAALVGMRVVGEKESSLR